MNKPYRATRLLALVSALLLGSTGAALAEDEASESQETPAVESAPPESPPDTGEEETTTEEDRGSETESTDE